MLGKTADRAADEGTATISLGIAWRVRALRFLEHMLKINFAKAAALGSFAFDVPVF
ncbi:MULTISPECIES: hypothetical protein [unclassified Mesorhizobium]|uniref:hypothetical protein n=1 Tax=unclassified Mesorhizobium TaxID=325217 RepID=UPI0013E3C3C7|nr:MULTISPECIES: hypothetical protein [unclassified Mesorhizobium]